MKVIPSQIVQQQQWLTLNSYVLCSATCYSEKHEHKLMKLKLIPRGHNERSFYSPYISCSIFVNKQKYLRVSLLTYCPSVVFGLALSCSISQAAHYF